MQNLAQIGDGAGTPKLRNLVKIAVFGKTHLLIFLSPFPSLRLPLFPSHPSLSPSLHLFPFRQSMVAGYTHAASIAANRSLSVSLSALISHYRTYLKNHRYKFHQIFCTCGVCPWFLYRQCNACMSLALWTTPCFHIIEQMDQNQIQHVVPTFTFCSGLCKC